MNNTLDTGVFRTSKALTLTFILLFTLVGLSSSVAAAPFTVDDGVTPENPDQISSVLLPVTHEFGGDAVTRSFDSQDNQAVFNFSNLESNEYFQVYVDNDTDGAVDFQVSVVPGTGTPINLYRYDTSESDNWAIDVDGDGDRDEYYANGSHHVDGEDLSTEFPNLEVDVDGEKVEIGVSGGTFNTNSNFKYSVKTGSSPSTYASGDATWDKSDTSGFSTVPAQGVTSGDTVRIGPGNYKVSSPVVVDHSNVEVTAVDQSNLPVIENTGVEGQRGVLEAEADGVNFTHLRFETDLPSLGRGTVGNEIAVQTNDVSVKNIEVLRHPESDGSYHGTPAVGDPGFSPSDVTVENSDFDGAPIGGRPGANAEITYKGNNIRNVPAEGIFLWGKDLDTADVIIRNNDISSYDIDDSGEKAIKIQSTIPSSLNGEDMNMRMATDAINEVLDSNSVDSARVTDVTTDIHNVDQDDYYSSVQTAVDEADPGETISLFSGTYQESVDIGIENLTLRGESIGAELESASGPVLQVNAPGVTVEELTVTGADGNHESGQGIDVNGDSFETHDVVIRDVVVEENDDRGLVVDHSNNVTIEGVSVRNNYDPENDGDVPEDGWETSGDADGILLWYTNNSQVIDSRSINNSDNGIYSNGDGNYFENVTAINNGDEGLDLSHERVNGSATVIDLRAVDNKAQAVELEGNNEGATVSIEESTLEGSPIGLLVRDNNPGAVVVRESTFQGNTVHVDDREGDIDLDTLRQENTFDNLVFAGVQDADKLWGSIQKAIDDAGTNDELFVSEGEYSENVTLNKENVTLTSTGEVEETVIAGQMVVSASETTVRGFTVSPGYDASTNANAEAFRISDTPDNVTIESNIVKDFEAASDLDKWEGVDGLVAYGGDASDPIENVVIRDNIVKNISGRETAGRTAGLSLQGNVKNATVVDNEVSNIGENKTAWALAVVVRGTDHDKVPRDVEILRNTIHNVQSNPDTDTKGVGIENEADASEITARWNSITETEWGAENKDPDSALNLSHNYWGEETGPQDDSNPSATGQVLQETEESIKYSPWLETYSGPTASISEFEAALRDHNIEVGENGYNSIDSAVGNATAGATVEVLEGTYSEEVSGSAENVTITSLNDAEETVVDAGSGRAFRGLADGVEIDGLKIVTDSGQGIYSKSEIEVRNSTLVDEAAQKKGMTYAMRLGDGSSGSLVEDNTFSNHEHGVLASGVDNVTIRDNSFLDGTTDGVLITTGTGSGGFNVSGHEIIGNQFNGNAHGIIFVEKNDDEVTEIEIHRNVFENDAYGVLTLDKNYVDHNVSGWINATRNYWGHPSGPGDAGNGQGDNVSENVSYTPWYPKEMMTLTSVGKSVEPDTPVNVDVGESDSDENRVTVNVTSSSSGTVTAEEIENSTTISGSPSAPSSDTEFVGGVDVEVNSSNGSEADASGTVRIYYDQDRIDSLNVEEDQIQIYYFNETSSSWESMGADDRDTGANWVEADVPHFSTYAAYGEEEESGTPDDNGGGDGVPAPESSEDEQTDDQTQEQNQTEPEPSEQEEQVQNQTQEEDAVGPNEDQAQTEPSSSITGQFLSSPTSAAGVIAALVLLLIGFLEYTGRIEVYSRTREKLGR
jgi:hypothetical protein